MSYLEAQMIEPIRRFMLGHLQMDITAREFSAGYGVADLVGAALCVEGCELRKEKRLEVALDHHHIVQVLLALRSEGRTSLPYILRRVALSESTLRRKVLPQLDKLGVIERCSDGYVRLIFAPPKPARRVVAVEAKQTRWRDAILQARRYTFFADQTYVAVWAKTATRVDKTLLYRHRVGLIAVESNGDCAIVVNAPTVSPRASNMNRFCAEFLYGLALRSGSIGHTHTPLP
jgi:hypothetical protein